MLSLTVNVAYAGGPESLKIGDVTLQKNGSGYRKKSFLTLYEGTLYLAQPSRDAGQIMASDAAMAIRLEIQSGFVSQQKMLDAIEEGFKNATSGQVGPIAAEIQAFRKCFRDPIEKGDVFLLAYSPGSGVTVYKNGQAKGVINGVEFKKAVFGIWLSSKPADAALRTAMLGR
jgi:hypothetical protein